MAPKIDLGKCFPKRMRAGISTDVHMLSHPLWLGSSEGQQSWRSTTSKDYREIIANFAQSPIPNFFSGNTLF